MYKKIIFFILLSACFTASVSAPVALAMGIAFAILAGNPYAVESAKTVKHLLKIAIVGLGFGMNFFSAVKAGREGLLFTIGTIVLVLSLGYLLGKLLKIDPKHPTLFHRAPLFAGEAP